MLDARLLAEDKEHVVKCLQQSFEATATYSDNDTVTLAMTQALMQCPQSPVLT